jgi:hypothetical protein
MANQAQISLIAIEQDGMRTLILLRHVLHNLKSPVG